ncbi:MAG: aminoglycoside phosphotransferase family enzyme/predicted kinase [Acidimicrobiales bacterium]|jgi:aminoglycoside phosphotransferase family enzyme/predicted kinase
MTKGFAPEKSEAAMPSPSVAETHISTVFFSADRAYKLLKPLKTSFLDHETVASRLRAVDEELALNRRLAPDVYLGTADVIEGGEIVDRFLVMRRLPASRRITALVGTDEFPACVRSVARAIAVFHGRQQPAPDARELASRDAVRKNWYDNFTDIEPIIGKVIPVEDADRVKHLVDRFLDHREELFEQRIAMGNVCEGHGDLTAEDVFCLAEGPRILDCLAFDRRLRVADVLLDVAFLAMDLDRLAGASAAHDFIAAYCEFSNEHHPPSLAHHYVAYRANVRAKVAAIRYGQGDESQSEVARVYHDLCLRHLERAALTAVLVGGTPGTGKSTLAQGLSASLGSMVLTTDELRKDLAGRGHLEHQFSATDEGIYREEMTEQTYAELVNRAATLLDRAESVVLDASWNRAKHRQLAREMAESKGAEIIEIECRLDPATAKDRIARRLAQGNDPSDARPELVDELRERFEEWPAATPINTTPNLQVVLQQVLDQLSFS